MMKAKLLLLISILLLLLTGCSRQSQTQDHWSEIKQGKRVVVGLDDSFVPMGFTKKDGQLTGYDVDLAKAVFALYDIKVDFQTIDWSMNVTELRNGTIDLIWNGFSITPEREKR